MAPSAAAPTGPSPLQEGLEAEEETAWERVFSLHKQGYMIWAPGHKRWARPGCLTRINSGAASQAESPLLWHILGAGGVWGGVEVQDIRPATNEAAVQFPFGLGCRHPCLMSKLSHLHLPLPSLPTGPPWPFSPPEHLSIRGLHDSLSQCSSCFTTKLFLNHSPLV